MNMTMTFSDGLFAPTASRAWLVSLDELPAWAYTAAIPPALLMAMLTFIDANITDHLGMYVCVRVCVCVDMFV